MSLHLPAMPARRVQWILCAALALPFIVAVVSVLAGSDAPRDYDNALIELRTTDVLTAHSPLVGSYERFGGNQPGPWLFYLLKPGAWLFGVAGIAATTALLGWLFAAGTIAVARRMGSVPLMSLFTIGILVMLGARGLHQVTNPWEPTITLLGLTFFAMLMWEFCSGHTEALPALGALGFALAGVWVLLAPVILVAGCLALWVLAVRWMHTRRCADRTATADLVRAVVLTVGVVALLAVPMVIEQLSTDPGNVTELIDVAQHSTEGRAGIAAALSVLSQQLDIWPAWVGGDFELGFDGATNTSTRALPIVGLLWVASIAAVTYTLRHRERVGATGDAGTGSPEATRERLTDALWLHATVAALAIGVLLGTAWVTGGIFSWITEPSRAIGMLVVVATAWSVLVIAPADLRSRLRAPAALLTGLVLVVLTCVVTMNAASAGSGPVAIGPAIAELSDAGTERVGRTDTVLVESDTTAGTIFGSDHVGLAELVAELSRDGVDVVVDPAFENRFGAHRADASRADVQLRLRSDPDRPEGTGWELLDSADPFTTAERERRESLDREIERLAGGAEGAKLLEMADRNDTLAQLLSESFELGDQPVLYLWYRPLDES